MSFKKVAEMSLEKDLLKHWEDGYTSKEFIEYYDIIFKLCISEKQDYVYDTVINILKTEKGDPDYLKKAEKLYRVAGYINRTWTKFNNKKDLFTIAKEIKDGSFETTSTETTSTETTSTETTSTETTSTETTSIPSQIKNTMYA